MYIFRSLLALACLFSCTMLSAEEKKSPKLSNGEYLATSYDVEANRIENVFVQIVEENGVQKVVSKKAPVDFTLTYGVDGTLYLHGVYANEETGVKMFTGVLEPSSRGYKGKMYVMTNGQTSEKPVVFQLVPKSSL